jgi:hypothetical protein
MEKYLPLGSIVLLEGGEKRIMIYGRRQKAESDGVIWDYVACLYPEGNVSDEYTYLFNHEQIERVFFIGFQEDEEFQFNETLRTASEDGVS